MPELSLHPTLQKKWSFTVRISSVNVTKSAGNCGFGHICWRNPLWKILLFVRCNIDISEWSKNGQLGCVNHIKINRNVVETIFINLDDEIAGQKKTIACSNQTYTNNRWIPRAGYLELTLQYYSQKKIFFHLRVLPVLNFH